MHLRRPDWVSIPYGKGKGYRGGACSPIRGLVSIPYGKGKDAYVQAYIINPDEKSINSLWER